MTDPDPITELQVDQRRHWHRGEQLPVEYYRDRHEALRDNPDAVLDLIYNEMVLREEAGQSPRFSEYARRFPHLVGQLRPLFEVHEVLERGGLRAVPGGAPEPHEPIVAARSGRPAMPGYEILDELGRDGTGVVYRARQISLNRLVALRVVPTGRYTKLGEYDRLRAEAEVVGLQHPNIVQTFQLEEHDGPVCLSLELVEGGTLRDRLGRGPALPPLEAAQLVEALARAAAYAHGRGVTHGNLSADTVLMTAAGAPKIAGFGVARFVDVRVAPATDVRSLGTILDEMLAGQEAPPDLVAISHWCRTLHPTRGYGDATALADGLARFARGEPVPAHRATVWSRLVSWVRGRA